LGRKEKFPDPSQAVLAGTNNFQEMINILINQAIIQAPLNRTVFLLKWVVTLSRAVVPGSVFMDFDARQEERP